MSCPTGWSENFAGNCYLLVTEELNWGAARAFCKDNNTDSDLASLLTQVENSHVTSLVAAVGGEMDWWMGFNDRLTEGDFQWSDGSPVHYDNWEEGTYYERINDFTTTTCTCTRVQVSRTTTMIRRTAASSSPASATIGTTMTAPSYSRLCVRSRPQLTRITL